MGFSGVQFKAKICFRALRVINVPVQKETHLVFVVLQVHSLLVSLSRTGRPDSVYCYFMIMSKDRTLKSVCLMLTFQPPFHCFTPPTSVPSHRMNWVHPMKSAITIWRVTDIQQLRNLIDGFIWGYYRLIFPLKHHITKRVYFLSQIIHLYCMLVVPVNCLKS